MNVTRTSLILLCLGSTLLVNAAGADAGRSEKTLSLTSNSSADSPLSPPHLVLILDRDEIFLGESVIVYAMATDAEGIDEFHLLAADEEIADIPETYVYTPTVHGNIDLTVTATDTSGHAGHLSKTLVVNPPPPPVTTAISLCKGFDPLTGNVWRPENVFALFVPEMRENITNLSLSKGAKFRTSVVWHFNLKEGAVEYMPNITPYMRREAVFFSGRRFESVRGQDLLSATFESWPEGQIIGANDTIVARIPTRKGEFVYYKIGKVRVELSELEVHFSYQQIFKPWSPKYQKDIPHARPKD